MEARTYIINRNVFMSTWNGIGYIKIYGKGIQWKKINRHGLSFSQRIGKRSYLKMFGYCVSFL